LTGVVGIGAVGVAGAGAAYAYSQQGGSLGFEQAATPAAIQPIERAPKEVKEVPESPAVQETGERELRQQAALAAVSTSLQEVSQPRPQPFAVEELRAALQAAEAEGAFSDDILAARRRLGVI